MIDFRSDPVLAGFGCMFLVLTVLAVRDGVKASCELRREGRADLRTLWRVAAIRVLTAIVGLSGVTFAATVSFDTSIHAGLNQATRDFRATIGALNAVSFFSWLCGILGLGWMTKAPSATREDAADGP